MVGKLIQVLLDIYRSLQQRKNFVNQSRIDKVIAMVNVAHIFDSQCTITVLAAAMMVVMMLLLMMPMSS